MKTRKIPTMPYLIPRLFSSGILRRASLREQPARIAKRMDSWLVFGLTRMGQTRVGK
jgi:hypothetical protein